MRVVGREPPVHEQHPVHGTGDEPEDQVEDAVEYTLRVRIRGKDRVELGERSPSRADQQARLASPFRACASSWATSATRSCGPSTRNSGSPSVKTRTRRRPVTDQDAFHRASTSTTPVRSRPECGRDVVHQAMEGSRVIS